MKKIEIRKNYTKKEKITLIIAYFMCVFCAVLLIVGFINFKSKKLPNVSVTHLIFEMSERSYFEGQKDALSGDIRINSDTIINQLNIKQVNWYWVKSPWNSGKNPVFIPSEIMSKTPFIWDTWNDSVSTKINGYIPID